MLCKFYEKIFVKFIVHLCTNVVLFKVTVCNRKLHNSVGRYITVCFGIKRDFGVSKRSPTPDLAINSAPTEMLPYLSLKAADLHNILENH